MKDSDSKNKIELEKNLTDKELKHKQKTEKLKKILSIQTFLTDMVFDSFKEGGDDEC